MSVDVGDPAPDFELRDQTGQPVRLSDYEGKKAVLLVFFVLPFTQVCEGEMRGLRDRAGVFRGDEVETLAVSVAPVPALRAWADQQGLEFPLLSDFWPHGEVARTYGVFDEELGIAERATFILDRHAMVVHTDRGPLSQPRDQDAWEQVLASLGA